MVAEPTTEDQTSVATLVATGLRCVQCDGVNLRALGSSIFKIKIRCHDCRAVMHVERP